MAKTMAKTMTSLAVQWVQWGGDFVRRAREHLELSPIAFGEALGVTRQTVWRYERGEPVPKMTRLAIERLLIDHEKTHKKKRAS